MSLEVQVFDNLKVKEENGQVLFDAESAAIGLGITDEKSGLTYVRWNRVNKYLFATSGENVKRGDFITEPQFYKLAIKPTTKRPKSSKIGSRQKSYQQFVNTVHISQTKKLKKS